MTSDGDAPHGEHYFHRTPAAPSEPVDFDVILPGAAFRLRTDRGVFSHGRLDTGTGLLLRHGHPAPTSGDLLDLGCGAGAIALTLAQRSPDARIWAVDVNERARSLCRLNAESAGIDNLVVSAPEEVPDDVRFAAIWSNPPIRIGKQPLHDLLLRWLARMTSSGEALLVVQRHLGADSLAKWLRSEGYAVERLSSKSGFRLLRAALPEEQVTST